MKTGPSNRAGFTLIEIMIVMATIGMLASIAIPSYVRARGNGQRSACINNLRQIDGAVQEWALEYKRPPNATVGVADVRPYLKSEAICQAGGTTMANSYSLTTPADAPTCITAGGGAANLHVMAQ